MYNAFFDFLYDCGLDDAEIFDAFSEICAELDVYLHEEVVGIREPVAN